MRSFTTVGVATALCVGGCASLAAAHTPYLLPNAFDAERDHITVQGALTEDDYFNPDIAIKADVYEEIDPNGVLTSLRPAAMLRDEAVVEAPLAQSGTYRFSTGPLVGRTMNLAKVGDRWVVVRSALGADRGPPKSGRLEDGPKPGPAPSGGPPDAIAEADIPGGAARTQVQTIMTAETYVSKGPPNQGPLKTSGSGFELKPITHPNAVYVDQGFTFQFLIDGAPAPGVGVTIYRAGDVYDDRKITAQMRTGPQGQATARFERPGVYLLTAHYPSGSQAPGVTPPARSYVYSLTFEVTR